MPGRPRTRDAFFTPRANTPEPARPESEARKAISREDLWAIHDAARSFFKRATEGRQDSEFFFRAKDALERAFERIPDGARR